MKRSSYFTIIIILLSFYLSFTGCSSEKIVKTFHLQDVEVTGPVNLAPIHVTDTSDVPSFTISPKFSFNTQRQVSGFVDGHTPVNAQGFFQVDTFLNDNGSVTYREAPDKNIYEYEGRNFSWNTSTLTVGLDLDMKLSQSFALFTGMNYSIQKNKSIWGGIAGLGLFSYKNEIGFRIDGGLHIQSIYYDAYTVVVVSGRDDYVLFYHDKDKATHINPFINFTFNTAYKDWVANLFISAGFSGQTLADFEPDNPDPDFYLPIPPFLIPVNTSTEINDLRGESFASFFNITPGIYFNVNDQSRIIIGTRFYFETQIEDAKNTTLIIPVAQLDFIF